MHGTCITSRRHYQGATSHSPIYVCLGLLLVTNDGDLSSAICAPGVVPKVYIATVRAVPSEDQVRQLKEGVMLNDGVAQAEEVHVVDRRVEERTVVPKRKKKGAKTTKRPRSEDGEASQEASGAGEAKEGGGAGEGGEAGASEVQTTMTVTREYVDLQVTVRTGRFRVVRRLLAAVGLGVVHLHRSAVGPLSLDALPLSGPSQHVELSPDMVATLWTAAGGTEAVFRRRLRALVKVAAKARSTGAPDERLEAWLLQCPLSPSLLPELFLSHPKPDQQPLEDWFRNLLESSDHGHDADSDDEEDADCE